VFERFTDRARRVLVLAQEEARLLNHNFIGTEHILLALIHEGEGLAAKTLDSLGISLGAVREKVQETTGPVAASTTGSPPFTPRAKKVLELSLREALQLGHNYIGTEHMLLGLVREGEGVGAQVLVSLGADLSRVRQQVIQLLSGYAGHDQSGSYQPIDPEAVAASVMPADPGALVTWEDVEDVLRDEASLEGTSTTETSPFHQSPTAPVRTGRCRCRRSPSPSPAPK
jgi:ATP-dependent Clp protease ATP-binding subunit ClpA